MKGRHDVFPLAGNLGPLTRSRPMATAGYRSAVLALSGLVVYSELDEISGNYINLAPGGPAGVVSGTGITRGTAGILPSGESTASATFAGGTGLVKFPNLIYMQDGNSFAFGLWFRPTSFASTIYLAAMGVDSVMASSQSLVRARINTTSQLAVQAFSGSGFVGGLSGPLLTLGETYFLVVTIEPASPNVLRAYLNGSTASISPSNTSGPMPTLDAYHAGSVAGLFATSGPVDGVFALNRYMTESEADALYVVAGGT